MFNNNASGPISITNKQTIFHSIIFGHKKTTSKSGLESLNNWHLFVMKTKYLHNYSLW